MSAGIVQWAECRALDREVVGSNRQQSQKWHLAVTLVVASQYQGVKLGSDLGLGNQSWLWGSIMCEQESADSGASTLVLKPMGGVNQSPKQSTSGSKNGDIVTTKKKRYHQLQVQILNAFCIWFVRWVLNMLPIERLRCNQNWN